MYLAMPSEHPSGTAAPYVNGVRIYFLIVCVCEGRGVTALSCSQSSEKCVESLSHSLLFLNHNDIVQMSPIHSQSRTLILSASRHPCSALGGRSDWRAPTLTRVRAHIARSGLPAAPAVLRPRPTQVFAVAASARDTSRDAQVDHRHMPASLSTRGPRSGVRCQM